MSKSAQGKRRVSAPGAGRREGRSSGTQEIPRRPGESPGQSGKRAVTPFGHYEWVFLGLILLFVVVVRTRLLGFPLERDEGEYAYLGQLIQQGFPPYSLAYNMKLPGAYFMYALIMSLFGQTVSGIHLGLMVMNCLTILLVYKVAAKIINTFGGVVAACTYAFLSLSPSVLGFAGHATHFVVFWAMAGLLALLYALEKDRRHLYLAAGFLLSLAFIMKQPGIFFAFFGAVAIVVHHAQQRTLTAKRMLASLGPFFGGILSPLFLMIVYLRASGVFDKFWFFTFVYSFKYASQVPLSMAPGSFMASFPGVVDGFFLIWLFAALGLVSLFLHPRTREKRIPISLFVVCSFLTVCPGFYFRQHYFVPFLPAVSLLVGVFIDYVYISSARAFGARLPVSGHAVSRCIAVAAFATALIVGVVPQSDYLFTEDPGTLCRNIYGANPFPESVEIARFIERNTTAADTIAVIGSEPQLYFYSKRHSATGHIYTYGLMEIHNYSLAMQKEMSAEIEHAKPKFIVVVRVATSWLARPGSERFIFRWTEDYLRENYTLVGIVDIVSADNTIYKWYDDVRSYTPRSPANLLVFQRATSSNNPSSPAVPHR